MSNELPPIDSFLDEVTDLPSSFLDEEIEESSGTKEEIEYIVLEEDEIDPRLKLFSHSSRTLLHKCPRKYQLYRQGSDKVVEDETKEQEGELTFAYGTVVGIAIASGIEGASLDEIILEMFLAWDCDLLLENPRQNKSFWLAVTAAKRFVALRESGFLKEYELVYYEDAPAIELGFRIDMGDGFFYRGYVDAVLKHKVTNAIMVLEAKTSSGTANPAMYRNSGQALGYSVVLDKLFPDLSSYTVLYLVYETKSYEYKELPFSKSLLQRALWLQELIIDKKKVEMYEELGTYPMHGESCFDFFRPCEYLGTCTLSTQNLIKPLQKKHIEEIKKEEDDYHFTVSFYDLVQSQIEKGESQ